MGERSGNRSWSIAEEDELVRLVVTDDGGVSFETKREVSRSAVSLARALERKFNKYFDPAKVRAKLVAMLRRYRLFNDFLMQPNITYNENTNVVTCNARNWWQIISVNNGFAQYEHHGERQWNVMHLVFNGRNIGGLNSLVDEGNSETPIYIDDSESCQSYSTARHGNAFREEIASTQQHGANVAYILSSNDASSRVPGQRYEGEFYLQARADNSASFQPSSSNDSFRSTGRTRRRQ